jgi:hypothetical protein
MSTLHHIVSTNHTPYVASLSYTPLFALGSRGFQLPTNHDLLFNNKYNDIDFVFDTVLKYSFISCDLPCTYIPNFPFLYAM